MTRPFIKIAVLLALFASVKVYAQFDVWRPQNPPTVAGSINAIQMISPTTAYAVGENSTFIAVSDSGSDWNVKFNINGKSNLVALSFIDSKTGMTVGAGAALKTTDAGITWEKFDIKVGGSTSYNGVLMVSKDIAMIVGNVSSILRTTDGGKTWKPYDQEFGIGQLKSIKKIREDLIVVSGELGNFLFSSDSGKSWLKVKSQFGNTVNDFAFSDAKSAIAVGERGLVLITADTGKSWEMRPWDTTTFAIVSDLFGVDQKQGNTIAVGAWGTIVHSTDKGVHWSKGTLPIFINTNMEFHGISMWDKNYGMIVGDFGFFLRTTDGGATWIFIPQNPIFTTMNGVAFPKGDSSHGIAVGDGATILRTSDGGKKWTGVTSSVINWQTNLNSVYFSDATTAWACGEHGTVMQSTDFGASWTKIDVPTQGNCYSIYFLNSSMGWMSVDYTTVLETKTAGASWHFVRKDPVDTSRVKIDNVSLCDTKHGLAGPYLTTDGGVTWTENYPKLASYTHPPEVCRILTPERQTYALVVNDFGRNLYWSVLCTIVGDKQYLYGDEFTTLFQRFLALEFADSLHGTAVGTDGLTCQTTDGGMTWEQQDSRTTFPLHAVSMPLANVATSAGLRGSINRRTNKLPTKTVTRQSPATNSDFDITGVYPNPARIHSTLRFQLQRAMAVELRIFDLKGVLVESSDLGMMNEGEYEYSLSFAGLSYGGYIVEIRSPERSRHIIIQAGE